MSSTNSSDDAGRSGSSNHTGSSKKLKTKRAPKRGPGVAGLERILREERNNEAEVNIIPSFSQSYNSQNHNRTLPGFFTSLSRPQLLPTSCAFPARWSSSSQFGISHEKSLKRSSSHFLSNSDDNTEPDSQDQSQTMNPTNGPSHLFLNNYPSPGLLPTSSINKNKRYVSPNNNLDFNSRSFMSECTYGSTGARQKNQSPGTHLFPSKDGVIETFQYLHQKSVTPSSSPRTTPFFTFLQTKEQKNEENAALRLMKETRGADCDSIGIDLDLKL